MASLPFDARLGSAVAELIEQDTPISHDQLGGHSRGRNGVESVFSNIRARGIGHRGTLSPKWVESDRQMQWLVGGALLSETLCALAHESGAYQRLAAES